MPDTQYFTNIDGKYVKDAEAREQLNDLEDYVESLDQPWQPLQDGYSNFWFELTNDTLSPWLNFSAKNNDATIDWGDGTGEVALDTLTPTHTYSKAGRYVVKVKGVTGIAAQHSAPYTRYLDKLKYIELNSEIDSGATNLFSREVGIKKADLSNSDLITIPQYGFYMCTALESIILSAETTTFLANAFANCFMLQSINIPQSISTIGTSAFNGCISLSEIHCQATAPPILGATPFNSLPSDYIIYVPVGYAETYKAASGWSSYADHILEEGQTPNRAMLAKFNSAKTDEPQDDMR